ncbi:hypothetical protein CIL03_08450 [Virgibacillus indicus]|uniref:M23ase beta-sheet core domain-containing protein n=1 Tax=Virgibacillus indicus TaxID=2024554 RepID=A0A265NAI8_9BACI|nr:peptidoglycan DD-metalloendopeptidase family protein [Virgibacillus indicus]OZU89038.1 hypothetical protein CIL03_08450 [Virgibacillus indicus]
MKKYFLLGIPVILLIIIAIVMMILFFAIGYLFFDFGLDEFDEEEPDWGIGRCSVTGEIDIDSWTETLEIDGGYLMQSGDKFIEVAENAGIDPVLMLSISIHETARGTSDALIFRNNPGGLMNPDGSGLMTFSTLDEGIESMGHTLHNRIIVDGLITIEDLGSVYAPLGAENDPDGLNQYWVPNVLNFVEKLGGLTMNCENTNEVEIKGETAWVVPFTKVVSSVFGQRWGRLHAGIDIAAPGIYGQPAVAFRSGTVIVSELNGTIGGGLENGSGYGYMVVIDHGDGTKTRYAHLAQKGIPVGSEVKAGERIGVIGSTGHSSGPHLHFEILINDVAVDPLTYLENFNLSLP